MTKTPSLKTRIRAAKPDAAEPFAPRRRRLADEAKITWLVTENPMQQGRKNHDRFAKRLGARTIGEALATGSMIGDLVYDHEHRHIEVEGLPPVPAPANE